MTLEQYAYLGEIIAAIAVIASLVYIGTELRQNTAALQAQVRASRTDIRRGSYERIVDNPDVVRAITKARNGERLGEQEHYLLTGVFNYILTGWQYVYGEYEAGLIESEDMPIGGWRVWFHGDMTAMADYWRQAKNSSYRPDFVQWMEDNVVNEPETAS